MTSLSFSPARRGGVVLAAISLFSSVLLAQDQNAAGQDRRQQRRSERQAAQAEGSADANGNGGARARGNFDPAQMQEQMMTRIREQLEVADDAEWKLISERITAVLETRRNSGGMGAGMGMLFGRGGGQNFPGGQGARGRGFAANPEQDALRQAIADKLPDAEIKARMARVREARKANEEKLAKTQEDLRAVLTVRQEAMAVMAGLLP